jgi:DNA polymerase-3 subunit beta
MAYTIGERIRANLTDERYDGLYGRVVKLPENENTVIVSFEWPGQDTRLRQLHKDFPELKGKTAADSPFSLEAVPVPPEGIDSLKTAVVDARLFLDALTKAHKSLAKSGVPALENVGIRFDGSCCAVTGTNLKHWLEVKTLASGDSFELVPWDTRTFIKACKYFNNDVKFTMYPHDSTFTVTSGSKSATPMCFADEAYPDFPDTEPEAAYSVNSKALSERISKICYAASKDDTRPLYTGAHFAGDSVVTIVGHRLAVNRSSELTVDGDFILPCASLKLLEAFGDDDLFIEMARKYVCVTNPMRDRRLCVRRLEGEFPKLSNVIPSDASVKEIYTVSGAEYLAEMKYLKEMMVGAHKEYVKFENGRLTLLTGRGSFSGKVRVEGRADIVYAFDCDYMLDALNHLKGTKTITIKIYGHQSPIILTGGQTDIALVLPVRIAEKRAAA